MSKENNSHYVNNKEFLGALIKYGKCVRRAKRKKEEAPQVPEYIGDCLIKIATHLAFKPNYINYIFRDEMIGDAIENCLVYIDNFDPKKSSNPFAYFTQISYYAFLRRIAKEKRQLHTKYRYIDKIDLNDLILQCHDDDTYDNEFIQYIQKQAQLAEVELSAVSEEKKKTKNSRKPLYMKKRDADIKAGKRAPYKKDMKKAKKKPTKTRK